MCLLAGVPPAAVGAIRGAATKIILTGIPLVFRRWEGPPTYIMYRVYRHVYRGTIDVAGWSERVQVPLRPDGD